MTTEEGHRSADARTLAAVAPPPLMARNLRVLGVARVIERLLGVGVVLILARQLGRSDFGRYTFLLALVALAGAGIGELGTSGYLVREATRRPQELGSLLGDVIVIRLLIGGGLVAVLLAVGSLSGYDRRLLTALVLISFATVLQLIGDAQLVALQSLERLGDVAAARIERAATSAIAITAVVLSGGRLVAVATALLVASAAFVVFSHAHLRRRWRGRLSPRLQRLRGHLRPMLGFTFVWLLTATLTYVDSLMVYAFKGPAEAGLYGAAYRLLFALQMIPALYAEAVARAFSALALTHVREFRNLYAQLVKHQLALAVPVALAGVAFAGPVMRALYGEGYRGGTRAAAVLLVDALVDFPAWILFAAGFALGLEGRIARWLAFAVVGNIVANVFLIPRWGATGAASATLAATAAMAIAVGAGLRKHGLVPDYAQWSKPLVAAVPTACVLVFTRDLPIGMSVLIAGVVYAAVFTVMRGVNAQDRALLRGLLRGSV